MVPLFLLVCCPPAVFVFWFVGSQLEGSFMALWHIVADQGLFSTLWSNWKPVFFGSATAWKIVFVYGAFQLFLMPIIPGKSFLGPCDPKGEHACL